MTKGLEGERIPKGTMHLDFPAMIMRVRIFVFVVLVALLGLLGFLLYRSEQEATHDTLSIAILTRLLAESSVSRDSLERRLSSQEELLGVLGPRAYVEARAEEQR